MMDDVNINRQEIRTNVYHLINVCIFAQFSQKSKQYKYYFIIKKVKSKVYMPVRWKTIFQPSWRIEKNLSKLARQRNLRCQVGRMMQLKSQFAMNEFTPCQNIEYGKKNPSAIWSMESSRDTYLFEHAIGFKRIPWAFFEKMYFEKFKFLFRKYFDFKKYLY